MKFICIAVLAWVGVLAGCATAPSGKGSYVTAGDQPSKDDLEPVVKRYLATTLKDPDSVKQFQIVSGPTYITWYQGLLGGGGHEGGWLVCYDYNAKNSYGGYTGVKRDGIVVRGTGSSAQWVQRVNWNAASTNCW